MQITYLKSAHLHLAGNYFADEDEVIIIPTNENRLHIYSFLMWQDIRKRLKASDLFTTPNSLNFLFKPTDVHAVKQQMIKLNDEFLEYICRDTKVWQIERKDFLEIRPVLETQEVLIARSALRDFRIPESARCTLINHLEIAFSNKSFVAMSAQERKDYAYQIALNFCLFYKWKQYKTTNITWQIFAHINSKLESYETELGSPLGEWLTIERQSNEQNYIATLCIWDQNFSEVKLITDWFSDLGIFDLRVTQAANKFTDDEIEERIWKVFFSLQNSTLTLSKDL